MTRKKMISVAAAAAALVTAAPAAAAPKLYFECIGDSKVQNREGAPRWTQTAPAHSFQSGAGCGQVDPGLLTNEAVAGTDGTFGGEYEGAISAINVQVHSLLLTSLRVPTDPAFEVQLTVDGEELLPPDTTFRVFPTVSSTGLTESVEFSISRLEIPEGNHLVELRLTSAFVDYQHAWVYGASEVPSHVDINPVSLRYPRIRR